MGRPPPGHQQNASAHGDGGMIRTFLLHRPVSRPWTLFALIVFLAQTPPASWHTAAESDFQIRTTTDLVRLCSVQESDPTFAAASHFCEGFMVGVFRVLEKRETTQSKKKMSFCRRARIPSRQEVITAFAAWAKDDRRRLALPANKEIASFLTRRYPCPIGI